MNRPPGPARSQTPFFCQPKTAQAVARIARSTRLVLYVGAGATITQSGHSWSTIVNVLLHRMPISEQAREAIRHGYDLPKQASIVRDYFRRKHHPRAIADILRQELYRARSWRGGDYADSIALLCQEWAERHGSIVVVTTNFDQYLEQAFYQISLDQRVDELVGSYWVSGESATPPEPPDAPVSIIHIHGVVPENPPLPDTAAPDEIVLDEGDYFRTEDQTDAVLTGLFQDSDVLILGSSLEDAPLLRALWNNKGTGRRWAVYPRQNLPSDGGAYGRRGHDDMIYNLRCRMSEFGVDVIAPDFFCQAAQLVREVGVALRHSTDRPRYTSPNYPHEYNRRLRRWWEDWFASRRDDQVAAQRADHEVLAQEIDQLRTVLGDSTEKLKLELWLRWEPSATTRVLRLWASSTVTWKDPSLQHEIPIEADSPRPAVRAFCAGAAQVGTATTPYDRWRKYLAVPVRNGERMHSIQVGVFTLSTTMEDGALLDEQQVKRLNLLVTQLSALGDCLLSAPYHRTDPGQSADS